MYVAEHEVKKKESIDKDEDLGETKREIKDEVENGTQ